MDFDEYQRQAIATANSDLSPDMRLAVWGLGVAGEAGEVADEIKKVLGHGHSLDREKLSKEMGDVLWYLAVLADHLGIPLSEIAEGNIQKLRDRYGESFSVAASRDRQS